MLDRLPCCCSPGEGEGEVAGDEREEKDTQFDESEEDEEERARGLIEENEARRSPCNLMLAFFLSSFSSSSLPFEKLPMKGSPNLLLGSFVE